MLPDSGQRGEIGGVLLSTEAKHPLTGPHANYLHALTSSRPPFKITSIDTGLAPRYLGYFWDIILQSCIPESMKTLL